MISQWPEARPEFAFDRTAFDAVIEIIKNIRNLRSEMNVPAGKKTDIYIYAPQMEKEMISSGTYIERLAGGAKVEFLAQKPQKAGEYAAVVCTGAECFIPLGELVDVQKELARLEKERDTIKGEIQRANGKLSNKGFVEKAPRKLVEEEKAKIVKYTEMLAKVEERVQVLSELQL